MKTLYLECNMGAAGDMLMAALYELCPDKEGFLRTMNSLGLPGVKVQAEQSVKCGIVGTHMSVTVDGEEEGHGHDHDHDHEHHDHDHHHTEEHASVLPDLMTAPSGHQHHNHTGMAEIEHLLAHHMNLPEQVKKDALAVYRLIGEAESHAHGAPIENIHFHEVGSLDAVTDVVGVCLLLHLLAPEKIVASPVHVGSGTVRCAHGVLPVPAPATAHILQGVPTYGGTVSGELCTPTGAALLKHFVSSFGPMPVLCTQGVGYGMGHKEFAQANCVRAYLGSESASETAGAAEGTEVLLELCCNLDDMTPEAVAFARDTLLENGAPDAYTVPIGMKKGREAQMLVCLCHPEQQEKMLSLLFLHTSTLGVREYEAKRYTLRRRMETRETKFGPVRVKCSEGFGVMREKPEFDDAARLAKQHGISLSEVLKEV